MNETRRWRGLSLETIERAEIRDEDTKRLLRGVIVAEDFGLSYVIALDGHGLTRSARVERTDGRALDLVSDGAGRWTLDGKPRPDLDGAIDLDLWPSPLTNSLPVWRTDWTVAPQRFAMAYVDAEAMTVSRDEQIYTRLDPNRFRYEAGDGSFSAGITFDADGLVLDYPGLFTRLA